MSQYFTIDGEDIKNKSVSSGDKWDALDLYPRAEASLFIDVDTGCNLTMYVTDLDSDVYEHKSVSLDAGFNVIHLSKNYPEMKFSIDASTTVTAFYCIGW